MNFVLRYWASGLGYLLIGLPCALTEWATFYLLISANIGYLWAAGAGFVVATGLNYILSATLVFRSRGRSKMQEFTLTYVMSLGVMMINLGITALIISCLPQPADHLLMTVAKVIGTGCGLVLNYLGRQFIIFDAQPPKSW